jgi:intracellular multiplication protein IcmL
MSYNFYREHYQNFVIMLGIVIVVSLVATSFILYQITHRPLPVFTAAAPNGQSLALTSHDEPNYLPGTVIRWANKAAVAAYTFDFAHYNEQLAALRPYFTAPGWENYRASVTGLIDSVAQNQVFISSVAVGAPVIVNQGDFLANGGYAWRIQMPFIVTTQSGNATTSKGYTVTLTILKVPTQDNPVGMGIDQFVIV